MKRDASEKSEPVPLPDIVRQLYEAATSDPWRPGRRPAGEGGDADRPLGAHGLRIHAALSRAQKKSFVRAIKPLRRLLRNQGAVNDSLVEALFHLHAQSDEMRASITTLEKRIFALEKEARRVNSGPSDTPTIAGGR